MMEASENVAFLIDVVIFLQNNVSLGMLSHPLEDILVRNPTLSLFRGILQVGEQIIPPTLRTVRASLIITMHVCADVEVAHQLSMGLEQGGLLFLQKC